MLAIIWDIIRALGKFSAALAFPFVVIIALWLAVGIVMVRFSVWLVVLTMPKEKNGMVKPL